MRIGMIADLYKPHISGVTNYISLSKQHLEKRGHEVFVFTFGSEGYVDDESNIIRSPGVPVSVTGMHFNLNYSKHALHLLRTTDIVHVHHPFISGTLAVRYCRPYKIPIVFTSHTRYDLYAQAYLPAVADLIGETAIQAFLPAFCRLCDRVIAPSQGMQEVLVRLGVDSPIHVVPNGVDLKPFRRSGQAVDRSEFGFSKEDIVLIFVGRLGVEKNLAFLLRAFLAVAQSFPNVKLILVGTGPEKENLQYQAKLADPSGALVHFAGFVPYEQMPGYLAAADAFVTASVTEVHPLSVIEAMAAGLPVLGISSPGVGDTIQDGITGLLAHDTDIATFTAKMVRLVTCHEERKRMGERALAEADHYDIENTTGLIIENYQAVIHQAAQRKDSLQKRFSRAFSRRNQ
jgi:glycosyltransferase involved in cell wall biosynthesis